MAVALSSLGTVNVLCRQPPTRLNVRNLGLQQRFIAHKSEVSIPSTLSTRFLYLTINKSAQTAVKSSQKPQIVTETHENAETNLVNPKPEEEEKPKTGDSEDIVETLDEVNVLEKEAYTYESRSISIEYVEVSSDENKLNTDAEKRASAVSNSSPGKLNKLFRKWDELKELHEQAQKDIKTWGIGKAPIFLVYDNGKGKVKVFINEKEIHDRFGSLPFEGDDSRVLLGEKLAQANQVALDIERGVFKPPRNSSVYEFVDVNKSNLEERGLVGSYVSSGVSSVIVPSPSVRKVPVVGFYVLFGALFLWLALQDLFNDGQEEETGGVRMGMEDENKRDDNNFALGLESKRGAEKEGEVGRRDLGMKPSLMGGLWFEKAALQVQHLARQVPSFLALVLQTIRVWIKEARSGMKQLAMGINSPEFKKRIAKIQNVARQGLSRLATKKQLPMKPTSTDGLGYKNTPVGLQDTANPSHLMEQNGSRVFSQQDSGNCSNSKTMGGNADGRRRDEDHPSNSNATKEI